MSSTGLDVFDRTLQATHIWLNGVGEQMGPDKQRCYHILRAVLHALRDRLTVDEAAHLAAEMPLLVRGIFYEGYAPARMPANMDTEEEFLDRVAEGLKGLGPVAPKHAVTAVAAVLDRHISAGEMKEVRQMLPKALRRLFQVAESTNPQSETQSQSRS